MNIWSVSSKELYPTDYYTGSSGINIMQLHPQILFFLPNRPTMFLNNCLILIFTTYWNSSVATTGPDWNKWEFCLQKYFRIWFIMVSYVYCWTNPHNIILNNYLKKGNWMCIRRAALNMGFLLTALRFNKGRQYWLIYNCFLWQAVISFLFPFGEKVHRITES